MQTNSLDVWTTMYDDSSMISYAKMVGMRQKSVSKRDIIPLRTNTHLQDDFEELFQFLLNENEWSDFQT